MKIVGLLIVLSLLLGTGSSLSATVTKTSTTVSSSFNPSVYGQAVTLTAIVTSSLGAPPDGETVTFTQGQKTLGTAALSAGSAAFATSILSGGTDNVKAVYAGDSNFGGSTSPVFGQVVSKAATTTTVVPSQNPSGLGQSVTFTATVAPQFGGIATGTVGFYSGSTKVGTGSLSGSVASLTTTKLAAGTDQITAVYNGSTSCSTSTSGVLSQTVRVGTFVDSTMTWNGITRYYEVYLPGNLGANPPMVLMLHGTKITPTLDPQAVTTLNWGWQSVADQYGFILVKPASTYNAKTTQWNWDAYYMDAAFQAAPDDSGFLRQLIVNLTAQYDVDPKQVFVAGFSSGGQMAHRVGVEISDLVAAVVIGSGTIVGQLSPPPIGLPGSATAPVSIQEWHGTNDTGIPPCNNGTTKYSGKSFFLATVDDSFNYWSQQNACTQLQNNQPLCENGLANTNTTGNDATACNGNTEVQFIWEQNVAHSWQEKNDTVRWLFFAAHPKQ